MSEGSQQQQQQQRQRQRCDQEQPCGNCLRRFPVPVCEYRTGNRIPGTSTFLAPARAGGRVPLHPILPGSNSPLLQASRSPRASGHSPIGVAGWAVTENTTSHSSPGTDSTTDQSLNGAPWQATEPLGEGSAAPGASLSVAATAATASWLPLADPKRSKLVSDTYQASRQVLTYRLAVPGLVFEPRGGNNSGHEHYLKDNPTPRSWHHAADARIQHPERPVSGVDEQIAHLPVAQTTLNKKLLRIYFTVLSRFKASLNGDPDPSNPFIRHYSPFCLQDPLVMQIILYTSACFLHETGHVRTTALRTLKGHAIRTLNESLRPDSVGGRRDYTTTDSQRQSIPKTNTTTALAATDASNGGDHPSDAAIAGVIQLTVAEWYWGESEEDLSYHLRGLRGMIRLRGGFNQLGMNGLLAKNAIVHDVSISLAHEKSPLLLTLSSDDDRELGLGGGDSQEIQSQARWRRSEQAVMTEPWGLAGYAFIDPIKEVPLRMAHMSPLVSHPPSSDGLLPSFADCAATLGIHPATASILDNVRYLLSAVEAIYAAANEPTTNTTTTTTTPITETTPTPTQASRKARLTGKYMHEHISSLHPTIPGCRQTSSPVSLTRMSSSPNSGNYFVAAAEVSVRSGSVSSTRAAGRDSVGAGRSPSGSTSEPASEPTTTPEWLQAHDASDSPTSPRSVRLQQSPDFMYQAIRKTAIIYTRAIATGTPLSGACTESEFLQVWTTTWRVPLSTWNGAVGIFHWIMLAIAPACHRTPHARFVKNMITISTLTLGVENWAVAMGAARTGIRLQHWLGGQDVLGEEERDGAATAAAVQGGAPTEGRRSGREER